MYVNIWGTFDFALLCFAYLFGQGQTISECGGNITLDRTALISSPGYSEFSSPGVECTWKIVSQKGKSVVVEAINLSFGSEIIDDCDKGRLEIFDGCESKPFLVERICVVRQLADRPGILWVSSEPCVTIEFLSRQGHKNKFRLDVRETDASCGAILQNTNKNQTFGGSLPANPGNHNKCVWIIVVPMHKGKIELVFKDRFQVTSSGRNCQDNYVQVQDGRYSTSPLLGTFCGTSRPYPVYSSGRYLRVTLHGSDTGMHLKHSFKAQYNVIDSKPTIQTEFICKDDIFLEGVGGGEFHTPRYQEQYPANLHCIWKIKVAKNNKIILRFREFDVEGDSQDCPDNSDHAKVYNGLASWSPIIGRFCGREIPPSITSKSNVLRIEFQSNTQYAGRGFDAVYSVENTEKPEEGRNHFTGIMIGTTCGIIVIVLSVVAVFHTRKLRLGRAQSRRSEVASTVSFDVNAPPPYEIVMASPDLFPSNARQQSRGYAGVPHLHREISHLLGDPESDDEDLPPYPGLPSRDGVVEFCFGAPTQERRRSNPKERHVSESEQPSCQISAVWYRRWPTSASSSPNVQDLEAASDNQGTTYTLERQDSKDFPRPILERMDTSSNFVTDV